MDIVWYKDINEIASLPLKIKKVVTATSLTSEFKKNSRYLFKVELNYLGENKKSYPDEGVLFSSDEVFIIREVILKMDDYKVVKARSICSSRSSFWKNFLNCGTNSLGNKLFNRDDLRRSDIKYAILPKNYPLIKEINIKAEYLIARKSFFINKKYDYLILTECFLDDLNKIY